MYISEILEYDLGFYSTFQKLGMKDEHVQEFLEWSFGRVVSFDKRDWYRKWNRFHGKHLILTHTPNTLDEWQPLTAIWSRLKGGCID